MMQFVRMAWFWEGRGWPCLCWVVVVVAVVGGGVVEVNPDLFFGDVLQ